MRFPFLLSVCFLFGVAPGLARQQPNIVFFLSDDHTTQAISAYGSRIASTPHIDRIAKEGMRFDKAFCTESICGPSRTAFLTGKYGHVTGGTGWEAYDRSHKTFPEHLQNAGYQTALVGKFHLGEKPPGFDYYDILPGQGRYHDPELISSSGGRRTVRGHVSDVITDLAPTLLTLAGVPVPADMQGCDLTPLFAEATPDEWRSAIYYRHYTGELGIPPHYGIRTKRYKLIHYKGTAKLHRRPKSEWVDVDDWEFFDLASDPGELTNLYQSTEHQATIGRLKRELDELRKQLNDPPGSPPRDE